MTTQVHSVTDPSPMTEEAYRAAMAVLTNAVKMIGLLPLEKMAALLSRAETLAPLLDPTGWMKQGHNIDDAKDLIEGAQELMRAVARVKERAKRRGDIK